VPRQATFALSSNGTSGRCPMSDMSARSGTPCQRGERRAVVML
jgi:hypothetical protein